MITLRHITAAEVKHQQRERERERERERDKTRTRKRSKETLTDSERKKDRNIFHDGIRLCKFVFQPCSYINHIEKLKISTSQ